MSGVFNPDLQTGVTATDNPELAKRFGLTEWDEARGQYVAPASGDDEIEGDGSGEALPAYDPENPERVDEGDEVDEEQVLIDDERDDEDPVL